jgi:hypothetical protein
MPFTFDATLKELVVGHLPDYEAALRLPATPRDTLLNVDLSAVTAATDVAIGHGDPPERISDLNFQSGPDANFDARVLLYAALLHYRYRVPIHSIAVLRPKPTRRKRERGFAGHRRYKMNFTFDVVRCGSSRSETLRGAGWAPPPPCCAGCRRPAPWRRSAGRDSHNRSPFVARSDARGRSPVTTATTC